MTSPQQSAAAASVPFDARPLVEPVDRDSAGAFARALRERGDLPSTASVAALSVVAVFVGSVLVLSVSFVLAVVIGALIDSSGRGLVIGMLLTPVLVLIGIGAAAFWWVRAARAGNARPYRLDRFARANGMTYLAGMAGPGLPGMIFGLGTQRRSSDLVRGDRPRFVEFGNYSYVTGIGKSRRMHEWGYVAVRLDAPLPNIVLDAKGNNSIFGTNLPASFDKSQRLRLEGDFDRYFSLYCPAGYERDALYLFTPDLMARFIDRAAALDVEIVDDWMFLYGKRAFSTLDPATWAWLFSTVAALLEKLAQWGRWRDDRLESVASGPSTMDAAGTAGPTAGGGSAVGPVVGGGAGVPFAAPADPLRPPPGVARAGRRLMRRRTWVGAAVFIAIALIVRFWDAIAGLLGLS